MLIYSDCDGVLTTPFKYFDGEKYFKAYGDRDSFAINLMKNHLIFVSQDASNRQWAEYKKGIPFLQIPKEASPQERAVYVREHANKLCQKEYIYLGDSVYDTHCLIDSVMGFIPADGSEILKSILRNNAHIKILNSPGGCGCLESILIYIRYYYPEFLELHFPNAYKIMEELGWF